MINGTVDDTIRNLEKEAEGKLTPLRPLPGIPEKVEANVERVEVTAVTQNVSPAPKPKEKINRFTVVTETNYVAVAEHLIKLNQPCVERLKIDKIANEPAKNKALASALYSECVLRGVPLDLFVHATYSHTSNDGCKATNVCYYGLNAVAVYTELARAKGLLILCKSEIEFVLADPKNTLAMQPIYELDLLAKKLGMTSKQMVDELSDLDIARLVKEVFPTSRNLAEVEGDKTTRIAKLKELLIRCFPKGSERIIRVSRESLETIKDIQSAPKIILCLAGAYDLVGATGILTFASPSGEFSEKFPYRIEVEPSQTKLTNSAGLAAYSKNPIGVLATKFTRQAVEKYYAGKITHVRPTTKTAEEERQEALRESIDAAKESRLGRISINSEVVEQAQKDLRIDEVNT